MSDRIYTLPGMADWTCKVSDYGAGLWHKGGAGFTIYAATPRQEIADRVKSIMRGTTLTPDEAAFEAVAQASLNIDFQAMLKPAGPQVAPLLNAAPAVQPAINTEQIEALCDHLKVVYFALQKLRG